jgi:hypothetical protein
MRAIEVLIAGLVLVILHLAVQPSSGMVEVLALGGVLFTAALVSLAR